MRFRKLQSVVPSIHLLRCIVWRFSHYAQGVKGGHTMYLYKDSIVVPLFYTTFGSCIW